ncbi:hypothetical protein [Streptomyces sp. NPDC003077]|uniref:hypothetical protein n=1 Tax=Streptomyces sp. NPDC003077 TaxID=3154443 RepID=UPI0033B16526
MKPALWLALMLSVAGNVYFSLAAERDAQQLVLQVACGVVAIGCIAGLWMTRDRKSHGD